MGCSGEGLSSCFVLFCWSCYANKEGEGRIHTVPVLVLALVVISTRKRITRNVTNAEIAIDIILIGLFLYILLCSEWNKSMPFGSLYILQPKKEMDIGVISTFLILHSTVLNFQYNSCTDPSRAQIVLFDIAKLKRIDSVSKGSALCHVKNETVIYYV